MKRDRFKSFSVFLFIVLIVFASMVFLRTFILRTFSSSEENNLESRSFNYTIIPVEHLDYDFNKPQFEDATLNEFVDDYIEKNACTSLEYSIYDLDSNKTNIFLNCGKPDNMIYDYEKEKRVNFQNVVKDYPTFEKDVKKLLTLKYPKFVVEDIHMDRGIYDIEKNEMIGYYPTNEYGIISIKINYNEVKDLLDYELFYDEEYQNEEFVYDKDKKTIAFTFDDGPSGVDLEIVDSLVDAHAGGTFYLVGNRVNSFPKSVKRILDAGMEVGNHTYDHKSLSGLSDEAIKREVTKTNDVFFEATGVKLKTLRPSYGAINARVQRQVGMPIVLWDIDTLDWKNRNVEKIKETILENAHDGAIVLMHSLYPTTAEAVKAVLPELYKMGYQVTSVEKLAELKNVSLTSGMTIRNIDSAK